MKQTQKLLNVLVVLGITLTTATSAAAQDVKERAAKVVRIQGAARYSSGDNLWQPLKVGDIVKPGTVIQTAQNSFVDIVIDQSGGAMAATATSSSSPASRDYLAFRPTSEQDMIRIWYDSVLAIDKLTKMDTGADVITETELDLRKGRIIGTTKKLPAASRYEVKIPNGVAGIRGTTYMISAEGVVSVISGSAVIAYTQPDGTVVTEVVTAGNQFDARTKETSPIPDFDAQEMLKAAKAAKIGPQTPATFFVVDQTLYYVSPRNGQNGVGSGGGGGGN